MRRFAGLLGLWIWAAAAYGGTPQPPAQEIVQRTENLMRGVHSSQGEMVMTVVKKKWTRTLKFRFWESGRDRALVLITSPPREKGVASLRIRHEVWNYVPKIERVIKIPPSMMGSSWMGSHFTNDDLVKESSLVRDYEAALVETTERAYRLDLRPRPEAAVVWDRIELDIDRATYAPLRAVYYNDRGEVARTLEYGDFRTVDGRTFPFRWTLTVADHPGEKTEIQVLSVKFEAPIPERFFTLQGLKRLRP